MIIFRHAVLDEWRRSTNQRYPLRSNGGISEFELNSNDSVFVPVSVGYVRVTGAVRNPGMFPFVENNNAQFYINLAGGFQNISDKENIDIYDPISRITETLSGEVMINDGDNIIVRVREELK